MPTSYNQLTEVKKGIVRRQAFDLLLSEMSGHYSYHAQEPAPSWLGEAEATIYLDIKDRCLRAGVSNLYFLIKVYLDAGIRAAMNAEALRRAQGMVFANETEDIQPPILAEETGI